MNITKFLRTAFFIEHLRWLLLIYSNQLKIFWEISASKFQGQHATQLSRYEGLCPATKTEIHCGFSNGILQNFRAASFKNNFGGLLLKRKQEEKDVQWPLWFQVFTFSRRAIYLLSHEAMYFLYKFLHSRSFQLELYYQFLLGGATTMCHFFHPSVHLLCIISQKPYII